MRLDKLAINKWYLIRDWFLFENKPTAAKYLGTGGVAPSCSFELSEYTGFGHNGKTYDKNTGRYGYCVYLCDPTIIRRLTKDEVIMEQL